MIELQRESIMNIETRNAENSAHHDPVKRRFQRPSNGSPFVEISMAGRVSAVSYFIGWRILPSLISIVEARVPEQVGTALLSILVDVLLLVPFLARRFSGTPIGWLHPLVLPTALSIAFGFFKNPSNLLLPLTVWSNDMQSQFPIVIGLRSTDVIQAQFQIGIFNLMALVCTYAGFAIGSKFHGNRVAVHINGLRLTFLFISLFLIVGFFIQRQGGIGAQMATLAGGRFRMREQNGLFLVINAFLPYLLLLWYAYKPDGLRNPLFFFGFALAAAMQFVVTGSRSALFLPVAILLAVWMFHHHRLPAVRAFVLGVIAILMFGVLGDLRHSGRNGEVDFSTLLDANFSSAWNSTQEELQDRDLATNLVVIALVPSVQAHLYGATYVAAATFWLPRSIWHNKPRGAGAHAAALLFGNRSSMDDYEGAAYPISGVSEAYWNFGIAGIVIVFLLFGMLLRLMAQLVIYDPGNPFFVVMFLMVVVKMPTPGTDQLVPLLQSLMLIIFTYAVITPVRFGK